MGKEVKTVRQIIEEVCDAMCGGYCKYFETWKPEEHDDVELMDSEICENCPLNRLQ